MISKINETYSSSYNKSLKIKMQLQIIFNFSSYNKTPKIKIQLQIIFNLGNFYCFFKSFIHFFVGLLLFFSIFFGFFITLFLFFVYVCICNCCLNMYNISMNGMDDTSTITKIQTHLHSMYEF